MLDAAPQGWRKKVFLTISLVANLLILGFFKEFDFFAASLQDLLGFLGLGSPGWVTPGLVLPAGVSFYTFQAMDRCNWLPQLLQVHYAVV
jgi:D-alanyl-lipoteichoic acid acyltransferase DltB (MBOAT superfamily)